MFPPAEILQYSARVSERGRLSYFMRFFVRAVAGAVHGSSGHGCLG